MQGAARAAAPVAAHDPALDGRSPVGLDQLLADRPGKRLERFRTAAWPQPRLAPNHRPDQRVPAKAAVKLLQIVIDAQGESHAVDALQCSVIRPRVSPDPNCPARSPRPDEHLLLVDPEQTGEGAVARHHHSVASWPREPVRPRGNDVLLDLGGYRSFRRWTSTRKEREPATSSFLPRPRPPPRRSDAPLRGLRRTRTSRKVTTPTRKPPVAAATAAGSETSTRRSMGRGSARTGRFSDIPANVSKAPLVHAVLLYDLAAHRLHGAVHSLVRLEDPAHLAALHARDLRHVEV